MTQIEDIKYGNLKDGVVEITLSHWRHFHKLIYDNIQEYPSYIFRGQSDYAWKLESSYDRLDRTKKGVFRIEDHLNAFKNASKGRRGKNPQVLQNDNEWWALGQHYGLATPLLDFTRSAFVALYFAFCDETYSGENRAVFALHAHNLQEKMDKSKKVGKNKVELFYPTYDGNDRLIRQSGLFMKLPIKSNLEQIVKAHYENHTDGILLKIKIPNQDVGECLTMLNRMNINHSTLFPDLYGAAKFVNCLFDKPKYDYIGALNNKKE